METRTAKPGIEAVPPRGAGPATSPTAIGGGDVVAAIAVAPVGRWGLACGSAVLEPTWALEHPPNATSVRGRTWRCRGAKRW